jgi:hypothetical protein
METRRSFVTLLLLSGIGSRLVGEPRQGQNPTRPTPPVPGQNPDETPPGVPNADKKILENNDKDMKKKVEQLYELASQLKAEVEKTDSSKVLSLDLVRKAEEIEKLAHDIKNRSKG